jgi:murein L,D-transpeptidase YcbB/YkuD
MAKKFAAGEMFRAPLLLLRFYQARAFQPAWVGDSGPLPPAYALMPRIRDADRHGLNPTMYHLSALEALLTDVGRDPVAATKDAVSRLGDLELLLTDAFFLYGSHVRRGRVSPKALDEVWFADHPESEVSLVQLLQEGLEGQQLAALLDALPPSHAAYDGLMRARAQYHEIAAHGGWPQVPEGSKLRKGDHGARVQALRRRLLITGDLPAAASQDGEVFDVALEQALQRFQRRHGLEADGVVGPSTLTALNVPVEARLRQIELNMERWRWWPRQLGERAILVNIPAFELAVLEQDKPALTMRVVVGRPTRRTPMLSADITYLVLNPHWYVPPNLAIQDKLPLMRKDPGYVARQRLKIFRSGGTDDAPIDPSAIDWSAVGARNFPYRLRQDPGPGNALGRVKFMFPNPFHVYLHDTPARELFAKTERSFSSGCIRLERPLELAEYVLSGDPTWSRAKMQAIIDTKKERTVRLSTPIPVHVLYNTAWMNAAGAVEFRQDIYDRDKALERMLREAFPPPPGESRLKVAMRR